MCIHIGSDVHPDRYCLSASISSYIIILSHISGTWINNMHGDDIIIILLYSFAYAYILYSCLYNRGNNGNHVFVLNATACLFFFLKKKKTVFPVYILYCYTYTYYIGIRIWFPTTPRKAGARAEVMLILRLNLLFWCCSGPTICCTSSETWTPQRCGLWSPVVRGRAEMHNIDTLVWFIDFPRGNYAALRHEREKRNWIDYEMRMYKIIIIL